MGCVVMAAPGWRCTLLAHLCISCQKCELINFIFYMGIGTRKRIPNVVVLEAGVWPHAVDRKLIFFVSQRFINKHFRKIGFATTSDYRNLKGAPTCFGRSVTLSANIFSPTWVISWRGFGWWKIFLSFGSYFMNGSMYHPYLWKNYARLAFNYLTNCSHWFQRTCDSQPWVVGTDPLERRANLAEPFSCSFPAAFLGQV